MPRTLFQPACLVFLLLLSAATLPAPPVAVSVYGTGLNNPRGLSLVLTVISTSPKAAQEARRQRRPRECTQVPGPVGPYSGGFTARISKFDRHGNRTTVADGLPSSQTSPDQGSLVSGVSGVAFIGDGLAANSGRRRLQSRVKRYGQCCAPHTSRWNVEPGRGRERISNDPPHGEYFIVRR